MTLAPLRETRFFLTQWSWVPATRASHPGTSLPLDQSLANIWLSDT